MTCWTSSSARLLAVAALAAGLACGHGTPRELGRPMRLVVLPPYDLSASGAPVAELRKATELALARIGAEVVTGAPVDEFLATHRVRYTGGLDGVIAAAVRDELVADSVLLTTVTEWHEPGPPSISVTMRLVSAEEDPRLLWIHGAARSGADHLGLLGLGMVTDASGLLGPVLDELRDSLRREVAGGRQRSVPCGAEARFAPQTVFRFQGLDLAGVRRVAVLPFEGRGVRRGAGEAMALEVARGLASVPSFRLVEAGVTRRMMLGGRFVMVDGMNLELGDLLMANADVDLVVTGVVEEHDEAIPAISFSTVVFDTRMRRVVWRSSSHHRGADGVVLFEAGTVRGAGALACRMVAPLVRELVRPAPRARSLASIGPDARVAPR